VASHYRDIIKETWPANSFEKSQNMASFLENFSVMPSLFVGSHQDRNAPFPDEHIGHAVTLGLSSCPFTARG
jgi:hypothetical protein